MEINRDTYEEFFILYTDNELNAGEKRAVEEFVKENPDLEQELALLKETVFVPDHHVLFENKELLYRKEPRRVIPPAWYRFAAAAVILFTFGLFGWLYLSDRTTNPSQTVSAVTKDIEPVAETNEIKTEPAITTNVVKHDPTREPVIRNRDLTTKQNIHKTNDAENREPVSTLVNVPLARNDIPEVSSIIPEDVTVTEREIIDVAVSPREVSSDDEKKEQAVNTVYYTYAAPEKNNEFIYFANTSLPKKTKLRGVFRKATRFLDKVTSLQ